MKPDDLECWRCSAEGKNFALPSHPDGGGTICHECWKGIYESRQALMPELLEAVTALEEILPSVLSCDDFHHEVADRHHGVEICPVAYRYTERLDAVRAILAKLSPAPSKESEA